MADPITFPAALAVPPNDARATYVGSNPWTDPNGVEWLWEAAATRWNRYVESVVLPTATTEEMEAGTETGIRIMSPALVKSAIEELAPVGLTTRMYLTGTLDAAGWPMLHFVNLAGIEEAYTDTGEDILLSGTSWVAYTLDHAMWTISKLVDGAEVLRWDSSTGGPNIEQMTNWVASNNPETTGTFTVTVLASTADLANAAQGALAATAVQPGDLPVFGDIVTYDAADFAEVNHTHVYLPGTEHATRTIGTITYEARATGIAGEAVSVEHIAATIADTAQVTASSWQRITGICTPDVAGNLKFVTSPSSSVFPGGKQWSTNGWATASPNTVWVELYQMGIYVSVQTTLEDLAPKVGYTAATVPEDASQIAVIALTLSGGWTNYWLKSGTPNIWVELPENTTDKASAVIPVGSVVIPINSPGTGFVGGGGQTLQESFAWAWAIITTGGYWTGQGVTPDVTTFDHRFSATGHPLSETMAVTVQVTGSKITVTQASHVTPNESYTTSAVNAFLDLTQGTSKIALASFSGTGEDPITFAAEDNLSL